MSGITTRAAAVLVVLAIFGSCAQEPTSSAPPTIHLSAPSFPSVEDLASEADTILIGDIERVHSRVVEGEKEDGGIPMVYLELAVDEVLRADRSVGASTLVLFSTIDPTKWRLPEYDVNLAVGDRIVLFGSFIAAEEAPIELPSPGIVSVLGIDAGLFSVSGDDAVARSADLMALRTSDVPANYERDTSRPRLQISLADLRSVVSARSYDS